MISLKRILVPTDFSENAGLALRYGQALAASFQSELHLLHVLQDLVSVLPEPGLAFPPPGDYIDDLKENAERGLRDILDPIATAGISVVHELRQGPPFLEIVRYASEVEIDLIVLGTHGRTGLAHILLGSVAEKVVRKAPCPVLTVRPDEHEFVMP